ncbi:hypothetical protein, partial [Pseudomonas syringae]|uniref:hypothetical protein n=1 Tax=Pseudomonas syringae TaxID=317 RepID=UPI0034D97D1C
HTHTIAPGPLGTDYTLDPVPNGRHSLRADGVEDMVEDKSTLGQPGNGLITLAGAPQAVLDSLIATNWINYSTPVVL